MSNDTLAQVQQALNARSLWCPLPGAVSARFAERRQREFAELARIGWLLVVLTVGLVLGALWWQFHVYFVGNDGVIWWRLVGILLSLVLAAMIAVQFAWAQRCYVPLLTLTGMAVTSSLLACGTLFANPLLMQLAFYVSTLAVIVIMLPLKLPLEAAVFSTLGGLVLGDFMALQLGGHPAWSLILTYYLGTFLVSFFVALLMQRQDRINFLQELLLTHESAERMRLNAMLERLALEDQLTGLANRRRFNDALYHEWERCRRAKQSLALLFMDIDFFKRYNDSYGHAAGDQCLSSVGQAIKGSLLRPADLAARYGGEEFVVMLPDTDQAGARDVAQRVLAHIDVLAIPHQASEVAAHVTASIGIAVQTPDRHTLSSALLESADKALYEAKKAGRHQLFMWAEREADAV